MQSYRLPFHDCKRHASFYAPSTLAMRTISLRMLLIPR